MRDLSTASTTLLDAVRLPCKSPVAYTTMTLECHCKLNSPNYTSKCVFFFRVNPLFVCCVLFTEIFLELLHHPQLIEMLSSCRQSFHFPCAFHCKRTVSTDKTLTDLPYLVCIPSAVSPLLQCKHTANSRLARMCYTVYRTLMIKVSHFIKLVTQLGINII